MIPRSRRFLEVECLENRLVPAAIVDFAVTSDWRSGFGASVTIRNQDPTPVSGWRLEFDFGHSIDTIWNARVSSRVGTHYVITDAGYNSVIAANGVTSFGFNGSLGNVTTKPTNYLLNGVPLGATAPPPPGLSIADAAVQESDGSAFAAFTVTLSRAATQPVTVAYATRAGSAVAGSDFTGTSGTLTFQPGQTSQVVNVAITGDDLTESQENFFVVLSSPTNATLTDAEAAGTISDDDTPPPRLFNYGEALQKSLFFYEAQRSGDLPDDYIVEWRGDAALNDGADVGHDLSGGYWDAGDHVKFALPMTSSMTLLAWGGLQYRDAYAASGQFDRFLDGLRWGTDWIVKAHTAPNEFWGQVGRGDLDHSFWGAPEVMDMARPSFKIDAAHPGSDLAGEAAASLAAASLVFRATDPAYADLLLRHARELYAFADNYRGKYSDSIRDAAGYYNSYSGYEDELVWGAAWLYKATGEQQYLSKAESLYAQRFAGQTMTWTHSWDDKRYGSSILLAQLTGKQQYRADVERWLDYWSVGINGGATRIAYTPGGLAFLSNWGSLRYATTTAFLALVYSDTVRDYAGRYHDFARGQINYALGQNPNQRSYVVGFGDQSPQFPHHRGASGVWDGNVSNPTANRHILYGALVGGPESADDNDYHDVRSNYISNEVALDYNAGFTGALARLYGEYGGAPLATFPMAEVRDNEFFVQASVNQQGNTFTEVRALLNNRSAWPARNSSELSFRYFVDLSEVYAAGYTVRDVEVKSNYSQGATLSGLRAWDAAGHTYYVEVSFAGVAIGPGAGTFSKEAQVRVGLRSGLPASAWNPANDWSYQGLAVGRDNVAVARNLPVYERTDTLLFGQVPTPGVPVEEEPVEEEETPPTSGVSVGFKVRDDWGTGFVADMSITNHGTTPVDGWALEFDWDYEIASIWNAVIVSHVGTHYVIRAASWNSLIAAGATVGFGFQGSPGNVTSGPTNLLLNGAPVAR